MNLAGRGIDNFPCASHVGRNGCRASETCPVPACGIIPQQNCANHSPAEAKCRLSLPPTSHKCLTQISAFSANFPWRGPSVSPVRGEGCGARPGTGSPAAWPRSGRFLAAGLPWPSGPARCQEPASSPAPGCWFYLSSVSWICENPSFFFFFFFSGRSGRIGSIF